MAALILPSRRVVQPQGPVEVDWANPLAQGLLFALNPAAGERNLALPKQAIALSPFVLSSSTTGRLLGTGASEYEVTADLAKNLTLFAVWRSRESSQYLTADGARSVFSARNAGNAGWTWGRPANSNAAAGGATGNVAKQGFTLNGIADYEETNHRIESLVDSPVAVRYIKSTGTISWFNKGKKSSPDTAASTAGTNGGTLVFRRQGPFESNLLPWIDRTGASFVWNRGLSDSEIGQVSENPWQLFRPLQRRIWEAVGGATIITALQPGSWSVRNNASALQAASWSVRNLAAATQPGAWSVRSSVAATQPASWSVRNFASATQPSSWSVRNLVTTAQPGAWSFASSVVVVSASQPGSWSVRNFAAATQPASWSVRAFATASQSSAWSVRNYAGATQQGAWSVDGFVEPLTNAEMRELLETVRLLKIQLQQVNGYTSLIPALL